MSTALALRLIASGAVAAADAEAALLSSLARRVPFVRALIDTGAISEVALERELEQLGGIGLRQVAGMPELVNRLPPHFCRRMGVLPVRVDHAARTVEVAAADSLDPHISAEIAFHLGVPVRVLRAPISAIEDAIRRIELEAEAAAGRTRRATPPFPHGAPESSNPPPPPGPGARKPGEKPPDTLPLYKQTLRPGEEEQKAAGAGAFPPASFLGGEGLDFSDAPRPAAVTFPESEPIPLQTSKWKDTRARDAGSPAPPPPSDPGVVAERARAAAAPAAPTQPSVETPMSAMVPGGAAQGGVEQPSVSFPSMPPPSIAEQPGLLAAEEEWSPPPAVAAVAAVAEARPESSPQQRSRRAKRLARPAIDIDIPQPPSENRARRQRAIWDVALGGDAPPEDEVLLEEDEVEEIDDAPPPSEPAPPSTQSPLALRNEASIVGPVLEALKTASSRDEVVAAALRGLRTVGRRTAIFVARRDGFHGWACNVELGPEEQLRAVSIPQDAPSLFATAVAMGTYFGPIPSNVVHASLAALLEHPTADVAAAVARAGGKPVMILFADDLVDIKRRVLPRLTEIADAVGAALSRLLAARL